MVVINMDICQCDFCGIRDITLPTCVGCGKHICLKHQFIVDFGVYIVQERKDKISSLFKESKHTCSICYKDRKILYENMSEVLTEKALEVIEEPLEEVRK